MCAVHSVQSISFLCNRFLLLLLSLLSCLQLFRSLVVCFFYTLVEFNYGQKRIAT